VTLLADPDHSHAIPHQSHSMRRVGAREEQLDSLPPRTIRMLGRSSTRLARHLCLFTSIYLPVRPHSTRAAASLNMTSSSPSTMHEALARIQSLERQLACAETLLTKYAARNLSDELVHAGLGPLTLPPPKAMGAPPNLQGAVDGNVNEHGSSAGKEPEASTTTTAAALDLGPLILRALEIRKQVHAGSLTDERAVTELDEMIEQHSLSEEQASTLRAWAGQ
jgi:hypothetical protein